MNNIFLDPKRIINTRTGEQAYKDRLNRLKNEKKNLDSKAQTTKNHISPSEFSLEDLTDFWTINNVQYKDGIYKVDLLKSLLDNKTKRTQEQWAEYSRQSSDNNGFYVGDLPLYHALFSSLFKNKDNSKYKDKIKEVKEFVSKNMFDYYPTTLTKIKYANSGLDTVIHNYNMKDEYKIQENIVGEDEYICKINPLNELRALLGDNSINNVDDINKTYKWITGKDTHLWRFNSKPKKDEERVARFDSGKDRFDLSCSRDPDDLNPAFGVRSQKIFK